jgi:hypothetical protein
MVAREESMMTILLGVLCKLILYQYIFSVSYDEQGILIWSEHRQTQI